MATPSRWRGCTRVWISSATTSSEPAARRVNTIQKVRFIGKPIVFLICLLPAAFVVTVERRAGVVVSKQEHVVATAGL